MRKIIVVTKDGVQLPPLLSSLKRIIVDTSSESYRMALEGIAISLGAHLRPESAIVDRLDSSPSNPFWRIRAEYYSKYPDQLASVFFQPEAQKWMAFQEMHPTILEGSRGTGKTMLLMALRARNYVASRRKLTENRWKIFGFYFRLVKGSFSQVDPATIPVRDENKKLTRAQSQLLECFAQEFYLSVIESFLSEVLHCAHENALTLDRRAEEELSQRVIEYLDLKPGMHDRRGLEGVLDIFQKKHIEAGEYITQKFVFGGRIAHPSLMRYNINSLKIILELTRQAIPELAKSQMTLLLDEYENLFDAQKPVINALIKLGAPEFSVKIARKSGTSEVSITATGEKIQETHDYNRVPLVYHLEDATQRKNYFELLTGLTENVMRQAGVSIGDVKSFLPESDKPDFEGAEVRSEVVEIIGKQKWAKLNNFEREERFAYYRVAATFRLLFGRQRSRHAQIYAGFDTLAYLSSGVVRYFQQTLGTAYHLEFGDAEVPMSTGVAVINPLNQARAVHLVSEHNLTALSRGVGRDGELLKYLLVDIGDILRQKLLAKTTEPEAGRIAITNPHFLDDSRYSRLRRILTMGVQEGVFQERDGRQGMRPKHLTDAQPHEFNIARIFTPALQFSYRLRWRSDFRVEELNSLIDGVKRKEMMSRLLRRVTGSPRDSSQEDFFSGDQSV